MLVDKHVQLGVARIHAISPLNEDKDLVEREELFEILHQISDNNTVVLANPLILRICLFRISTQQAVQRPSTGDTFRYYFLTRHPKNPKAFIRVPRDSDEVKCLVFGVNQAPMHGAKCITESVMRTATHNDVKSMERFGCSCLDNRMKIVKLNSSPDSFPFEYVPVERE